MNIKRLAVGTLTAPAPTACGAVRFTKDVLRIGTFYVDGRPWHVDSNTLRRLASNHLCMREAGVHVPVVWDHSESARDRIGSVDRLWTDGNTLWASIEVTDCDAQGRVGRTCNEVSVEVREPFVDGAGRRYSAAITHLGVVNLPVVAGQGDFRRLSLTERGITMKSLSPFLGRLHARLMVSHARAKRQVEARRSVRRFSTVTGTIPVGEAVEMLNRTFAALADFGLAVFRIPDGTGAQRLKHHMATVERFVRESYLTDTKPGDSDQPNDLEKALAPGNSLNAAGGFVQASLNGHDSAAVPMPDLIRWLGLLFECSPVLRSLKLPEGLSADELRWQWTPIQQVLDDITGISKAGGDPSAFAGAPDQHGGTFQFSLGSGGDGKAQAIAARQDQLRRTVFEV